MQTSLKTGALAYQRKRGILLLPIPRLWERTELNGAPRAIALPGVVACVFVALAMLASLAGCAQSPTSAPAPAEKAQPAQAKPQKLIPLNVGYSAVSASMAIIVAMKDMGIFEKHGLDVTLTYAAGTTAIQALIAGDTPVVLGAGSMTVQGSLAGADLVILVGQNNSMDYELVTRKEIKSPAELKGKRLAITRFGDSSDFSTRFALKRMGLSADEVSIVQIGGLAERFASIASGATDGTMVLPPYTANAKKMGYNVLQNLQDVPYQSTALITSRSFIAKNEETVRRLVTAWVEGIHLYKSNQDAGRKAVASFLKLEDKEQVEDGYSFYAKKFPEVPYPTAEGVQAILDELAQLPQFE